ncbi:MAG: DUF3772 domain-containing protein [Rhodospirillaceae bacterium]
MLTRICWLLLVLLGAGFAPAVAPGIASAQEVTEDAYAAQVSGWRRILDKAASSLLRTNLSEADYEALHKALGQVFDQARKASAEAAEIVATNQHLAEALGKPPAEDAPPEAPAVAAERKRLSDLVVRIDGRMRQADLLATRADILLRTANERRINQFAQTLFLRGVSPIAPETFQQLPAEIQFVRDRLSDGVAASLKAGVPGHDHAIQFGVLALLALLAGWLTRRHLVLRYGQRQDLAAPAFRQRVSAATVEALGGALVPALLILAAAFVLLGALGAIYEAGALRAAIRSVAGGLVFFCLAVGFGRALLAPRRPVWRLIGVDDRTARGLSLRLFLCAAALAGAETVLAFLESALVAPELHAVASFGAKLLGALVLLAVLIPDPVWSGRTGTDSPQPRPSLAPRLRTLAALLAVAVVVLSLLRLHNLGLYIAEMMLAGTGVAGLLLLLRGIGHELVALLACHPAERLARLRRTLLPAERDIQIFLWVAAGLIDLTLMVLGLALLLPISGIAWTELVSWSSVILRGVRIGEVTLSPADIASAAVLVIGIMAATRFLQRTLDDRVLEHLPIDRGVRHSIRTGIGYIGALVAIVGGIGTLGLSLSNLALIAGALSVGIGFGLQAIVSNFVAGLILLVERPIKVGDWIVIGEFEGVVKRISVRATEIQTFQFASVIIPNSELISKAVKNWTYKDKVGRIDIPLGVAYGCDTERVRAILIECARSVPRVSADPPPRVEFRAFGPGYLALELRCFVAEVNTYHTIATELRFAILTAFRAAGIEMPTAKLPVDHED